MGSTQVAFQFHTLFAFVIEVSCFGDPKVTTRPQIKSEKKSPIHFGFCFFCGGFFTWYMMLCIATSSPRGTSIFAVAFTISSFNPLRNTTAASVDPCFFCKIASEEVRTYVDQVLTVAFVFSTCSASANRCLLLGFELRSVSHALTSHPTFCLSLSTPATASLPQS